ncbi:MAG: TrlF family AAA-like ATPase [Candidatus Zhuqueibacterota bacterium]
MDEILKLRNGANFYKTDLHLHSPADAQFKAGEPLISEERKKVFARKFLDKVLEENIGIIAITDHNTASWFSIFQKLNLEGKYQQLIIFPGLEIATKEGIHLLVLFDRDFDEGRINKFLAKIGLETPFDGSGSPKPSSKTIDELYKLVEDEYCQNRDDAKNYNALIIPAHVEQKINGLLGNLKRPSYYDYEKLIVVQVNTHYEKLDAGVKTILEGKDPNYGNKAVAVIEASDARSLDDIGKRTSHLKLSSPTIEGLRQAFLDPESRIRHQSRYHPEKYSRIIAMKIEGGFTDGLGIHFNNSLNCIIGGKGTGKSTILEILKYALGHKNDVETLNNESDKILKEVFKPGSKVSIIVDSRLMNRQYLVEAVYPSRPIVKDPVTRKIFDGIAATNLLPQIDIYRQKEILELSKDQSAQLNLIKRFYSAEIKELEDVKNRLQSRLATNRADIQKNKKLFAEYESEISNLAELKQRLNKFKDSEIEKHFREKNIYEKEKEIWSEFEEELAEARDIFNDLSRREFFSAINLMGNDLINKTLLDEVKENVTDAESRINEKISEINSLLSLEKIKTLKDAWQDNYQRQEEAYNQKLRELKIEKTFSPDEYIKLEQDIRLKEKTKETLKKYQDQYREKQHERAALLQKLNEKRSEIFRRQDQICEERINMMLQGILKVKLDFMGLKDDFVILLASYKTGAHQQQLARITEHQNFTPDFFVNIVREGEASLMHNFGITEAAASQLYKKLDDDALFNLEEFEIPTKITISLNVGTKEKPNFKTTNDLSVGQKCTALLSLILLENNEPLIIDQPEDDLDKSFIFSDIVAKLRREKEKRQFIVATHDANLAVLGDAEQMIVLHASDKSVSLMKCITGASIDDAKVKIEVEKLLEGGKEAFNKRREKYGY